MGRCGDDEKGAALSPVRGLPFSPLEEVEPWQQESTQDSAASLAFAFIS